MAHLEIITNLIGALLFVALGSWLILSPTKLLNFIGKFYLLLSKYGIPVKLPDSFFLGSRPFWGIIMGTIMVCMGIAGLYLNIKALVK